MRVALHLPLLALLALAPYRALAAEEGKPDPWAVPTPDLAGLLLTLQDSERAYAFEFSAKPPEPASAPEPAPAGSPEEEKALRSCRDLLECGKGAEVVAPLRELLRKNPLLHEARTLLGTALLRTEKPGEAVVVLRDALIGHPGSAEAWKALGEAATALGKKVRRAEMRPPCWIAPGKEGEVEIKILEAARGKGRDVGPAVWSYFGIAKACYRYEGGFAADVPGEPYRATFRETLNGVGAVLLAADKSREEGLELTADLDRLLAERKAGTVVPFAYFALHGAPQSPKEEKGFDLLRPRLEKYFDEEILVEK